MNKYIIPIAFKRLSILIFYHWSTWEFSLVILSSDAVWCWLRIRTWALDAFWRKYSEWLHYRLESCRRSVSRLTELNSSIFFRITSKVMHFGAFADSLPSRVDFCMGWGRDKSTLSTFIACPTTIWMSLHPSCWRPPTNVNCLWSINLDRWSPTNLVKSSKVTFVVPSLSSSLFLLISFISSCFAHLFLLVLEQDHDWLPTRFWVWHMGDLTNNCSLLFRFNSAIFCDFGTFILETKTAPRFIFGIWVVAKFVAKLFDLSRSVTDPRPFARDWCHEKGSHVMLEVPQDGGPWSWVLRCFCSVSIPRRDLIGHS